MVACIGVVVDLGGVVVDVVVTIDVAGGVDIIGVMVVDNVVVGGCGICDGIVRAVAAIVFVGHCVLCVAGNAGAVGEHVAVRGVVPDVAVVDAGGCCIVDAGDVVVGCFVYVVVDCVVVVGAVVVVAGVAVVVSVAVIDIDVEVVGIRVAMVVVVGANVGNAVVGCADGDVVALLLLLVFSSVLMPWTLNVMVLFIVLLLVICLCFGSFFVCLCYCCLVLLLIVVVFAVLLFVFGLVAALLFVMAGAVGIVSICCVVVFVDGDISNGGVVVGIAVFGVVFVCVVRVVC